MRLGSTLEVDAYLDRVKQTLDRLDRKAIITLADLIYRCWETGQFVYIFGNGGSGCNATHMSEDLGKSTLLPQRLADEAQRRLKVLSLTDNLGWIMAVGNDVGYEHIFVQQLMNYGQPGDLVVAISGSGNSANVLRAVEWANRHGLITYGMTGFDGGRLRQIQQHGLHVPIDDMGIVESIHLTVFHWALDDVYARINRLGRYGTNTSAPASQAG